jgi:hypothetical protein
MQQMTQDACVVMHLLNGYWDQMAASCQAISGGQEIEFEGAFIGFVEGTPESVTIRKDGRNLTFAYRELPVGLALVLAEQGAISDIPTWNLQRAAYFAAHADRDADFADRCQALVAEAEAYGHDAGPVRRFLRSEHQLIGLPEKRIPFPDAPALDLAMREVPFEFSLTSDNYDAGQAASYSRHLLDLSAGLQDEVVRVAYLDCARQWAVRAGQVDQVVEVLEEMQIWCELDIAKTKAKSFLSFAESNPDATVTRDLCNAVIAFMQADESSAIDDASRERMLNSCARLAQQAKLEDLVKRLNSIQNSTD